MPAPRNLRLQGITTRPRPHAFVKPPYRVPTMAEISALEANGYKVISTFAGCGGSSTGYRMAGFSVVYANEFVEAARDTYSANMAPTTLLDGRDVREITAAEILAATGLAVGELDVADGSPPCASFSTAGKRSKKWGTSSKYSDTSQRTDDLFFEYVRLLDGLQPKVFIAENVSGLIKGSAKGYFKQILAAMQAIGYRVEARLLDASWLGVPQARQRLIFVGVRNDLIDKYTGGPLMPAHPTPLPYRYTLRDVLPNVARFGTWPPNREFAAGGRDIASTMVDAASGPAPTVMASGAASGSGWAEVNLIGVRKTGGWDGSLEIPDLNHPAPTISAHGVGNNNPDTLAVSDTDPMAMSLHWGERVMFNGSDIAPTIMADGANGVAKNQIGVLPLNSSAIWRDGLAYDPETDAVLSLADTAIGREAAALGHTALRKFTLAELRVICGFPADFVLTGTYAQRWERLGRSVPPLMMKAIAETVATSILDRARVG